MAWFKTGGGGGIDPEDFLGSCEFIQNLSSGASVNVSVANDTYYLAVTYYGATGKVPSATSGADWTHQVVPVSGAAVKLLFFHTNSTTVNLNLTQMTNGKLFKFTE